VQKLLLQLDTAVQPSVFDRIVAFDGGADHVLSYGGVTPAAVRELVHGAIFTRGPAELRHTAIFIGGTDIAAGERLLAAVRDTFFGPFRVAVMLDANGANTTAVASVGRIHEALGDVAGRRVVVVAGSGPVGSRVAGLLAAAGARVTVTSRTDAGGALAHRIEQRFGARVEEAVVAGAASARTALEGAEVVVAAGPAGITVVPRDAWADRSSIRVLVDLNAVPPAGIEGVEATDKATARGRATSYGALGVGSLKMKVHRACIARLFDDNTRIFDAETIADVAHDLIGAR
jgi:hypothetical protein